MSAQECPGAGLSAGLRGDRECHHRCLAHPSSNTTSPIGANALCWNRSSKSRGVSGRLELLGLHIGLLCGRLWPSPCQRDSQCTGYECWIWRVHQSDLHFQSLKLLWIHSIYPKMSKNMQNMLSLKTGRQKVCERIEWWDMRLKSTMCPCIEWHFSNPKPFFSKLEFGSEIRERELFLNPRFTTLPLK